MGTEQLHPSSQSTSPSLSPVSDPALELYKLEYERAAIRYEDIYKAVWQIFSYLSAVTAVIIAFGMDRFQSDVSTLLICLPLFFWFWSTYMPLDRYGSGTLDRLRAIEQIVNARYTT